MLHSWRDKIKYLLNIFVEKREAFEKHALGLVMHHSFLKRLVFSKFKDVVVLFSLCFTVYASQACSFPRKKDLLST